MYSRCPTSLCTDFTRVIGFGVHLVHRRAVSVEPIMRDKRPENRSSITVGGRVQNSCSMLYAPPSFLTSGYRGRWPWHDTDHSHVAGVQITSKVKSQFGIQSQTNSVTCTYTSRRFIHSFYGISLNIIRSTIKWYILTRCTLCISLL